MTGEADPQQSATSGQPQYFKAFLLLAAAVGVTLILIFSHDKQPPPSAAFKEGYNIGYAAAQTGLADSTGATSACEASVSSATTVHSAETRRDWIGGCEAGVRDGTS